MERSTEARNVKGLLQPESLRCPSPNSKSPVPAPSSFWIPDSRFPTSFPHSLIPFPVPLPMQSFPRPIPSPQCGGGLGRGHQNTRIRVPISLDRSEHTKSLDRSGAEESIASLRWLLHAYGNKRLESTCRTRCDSKEHWAALALRSR